MWILIFLIINNNNNLICLSGEGNLSFVLWLPTNANTLMKQMTSSRRPTE